MSEGLAYSFLSARIGSTAAARLAGSHPAAIVVAMRTTAVAKSVLGSRRDSSKRKAATNLVVAKAPASPITIPATDTVTVS